MRKCIELRRRALFSSVAIMAAMALSIGISGCRSSKPAPAQPDQGPKRYPLNGRVVRVEPDKLQVVVDHGDIPGFMSAMTMGYSVKNPNLLTPLSPEDQITADVVVNGDDVYLENIVVVKKAEQTRAPAAGASQPASSPPGKQ
jgi:Cu/Ag efflux protein CusF